MQKIIIIGGGISGTLLTIHLLRHNYYNSLEITVIEKNIPHKLGDAYCTDELYHLLNVPAYKMSAFPDNSDHFVNWLSDNQYAFHPKSFVPRKIYRLYIHDLLEKELSQSGEMTHYKMIQDSAVDIIEDEQLVILESGQQLPFDKVILALGNFKATTLNLSDNTYLDHPGYFAAGLNQPGSYQLPVDKKVLIIGTGLTMVDTVLSLRAQKHNVAITALSTHGMIPLSHQENTPYALHAEDLNNVYTLLEAFKIINKHIKKARKLDISWHAVIDAIRPYMQQIWINLPGTEKKKFMEHLRHIWGVARHRMPPECAQIIHELLSQEQLRIIAGRIRSISADPAAGFNITYQEKVTHQHQIITADIIINCMGPESNYTRLTIPLICKLLKKGMIRPDALKLGIDCTPEGIILDQHGYQSDCLYTIGPPSKGTLWEITSVPDIRVAAVKLAELVSSKKDKYVY